MKKVIKPKNLLGFEIWLDEIGYTIKHLKNGFTTSGKGTPKSLAYALVLNDCTGNAAALKLGQEYETHLAAPDQTSTEQASREIFIMIRGGLVEFAA